jgi:hypothetical protein
MSIYKHFDEKLFAERLERDKNTNVHISPRFDQALCEEQNYLEATGRSNIDYVNLGNYMKYVMED